MHQFFLQPFVVQIKRLFTRKHCKQGRARSKNICCWTQTLGILTLLRRHVRQGPHDGTSLGQRPLIFGHVGNAKIRNLWLTIKGQQHIVRLNVTMDDSLVMTGLQPSKNTKKDGSSHIWSLNTMLVHQIDD